MSAAPAVRPLLPRLRALAAQRSAMAWLVALLLLKTAVPLVAAFAAQQRGVDLADVCSVYGVRAAPADRNPDGPAGPHAGDGHCVLTPLLGAACVPGGLPNPLWPRSLPQAVCLSAAVAPGPHDARLAWLAAQAHAPPAAG